MFIKTTTKLFDKAYERGQKAVQKLTKPELKTEIFSLKEFRIPGTNKIIQIVVREIVKEKEDNGGVELLPPEKWKFWKK